MDTGFTGEFIQKINKPQYHTLYVIITSIIISLLFYVRTSELFITDPQTKVLPVLPQKKEGLTNIVAKVETGLYIKNFSVFDLLTNQFTIDATIWFLFNPTDITLDSIGQFSFLKGKIIKKNAPNTRVVGNKLLARYDITVSFSTNLDQRFFPIESHRIDLILTNEFLSIDELIYQASETEFSMAPDVYTGGLIYANKSVTAGYFESLSGISKEVVAVKAPIVVFSIDFFNPGIRKSILLIMPTILIFLLTILSFFFIEASRDTSIVFGLLTAILAYRFVIETSLPKVDYFTTTDNIYFFVLIFVFIVFLVDFYIIIKKEFTPFETMLKNLFILLSYPVFLIFLAYILFFWGRG